MTQKSQSAIVYPAASLGGPLKSRETRAFPTVLPCSRPCVGHFHGETFSAVGGLREHPSRHGGAWRANLLFGRRRTNHPGHRRQDHGAGRSLGLGEFRHRHAPSGRPDRGMPIKVELTGDASLCSRPMSRIKEPLELMGAKVELLGENNCAPIRIQGGNLKGVEYAVPVASAQVKSCILLAALSRREKPRSSKPCPPVTIRRGSCRPWACRSTSTA